MSKAFEDTRKEGIEIGREQGREAGSVETAKRMLADHILPVEEIARYVSLPLEQVQALADAAHT